MAETGWKISDEFDSIGSPLYKFCPEVRIKTKYGKSFVVNRNTFDTKRSAKLIRKVKLKTKSRKAKGEGADHAPNAPVDNAGTARSASPAADAIAAPLAELPPSDDPFGLHAPGVESLAEAKARESDEAPTDVPPAVEAADDWFERDFELSDDESVASAAESVFAGEDAAPAIAIGESGTAEIETASDRDDLYVDDVPEGVINSKLRKEARSIQHLLDHIPFNRYCKGWVEGKTKNAQRRKGAFYASGRKCSNPGDIISADQCHISDRGLNMGMGKFTLCLNILDVAIGLMAMYPLQSNSEKDIASLISHFIWDTKCGLAYMDGHPTLRAACRRTIGTNRINNFFATTPGRAESNPIIERQNYIICDKMRAALIIAGLPTCFWSQICLSVSSLSAIKKKYTQKIPDSGEEELVSAYRRWHNEEPKNLQHFIIGQSVSFMPAPTIYEHQSKVESKLKAGIFLGYYVGSSLRWCRQYQVMLLEDLAFKPISEKADKSHFADIAVHCTEMVRNSFVEDEKVIFPFKSR